MMVVVGSINIYKFYCWLIQMVKQKIAKESISKELLEILACPLCKEGVKYEKRKNVLNCGKCKAEYKIEGGIPDMLTPLTHEKQSFSGPQKT